MSTGIPAERLSDADLRHDLLQLKNKQADIERDGTADQKLNHQSRTTELEAEFVKRFGPASSAEPSEDSAGDERSGEPEEDSGAPAGDDTAADR